MKAMTAILRIGIIVSVAVCVGLTPGLCSEKADKNSDIQCSDGKLNIRVQNMPLSKLIEEIRRKCRVDISGLEHRTNETLNFFGKEEVQETVLKRLLRQLNEENYVFEYTRSGLSRIVVVPRSTAKYSSSPPSFPLRPAESADIPPPAPPPLPIAENASVGVVDVIQGSQAEAVGLQKGDVVVEYDGVKITDPQQLIQEVKSRETKEVVEVTVLRNNTPMTFVMKGGFMGINIGNTK